jgi:hypothetical protein
MTDRAVVKTQFYRGSETPRHKNKVSGFMVEHLSGDNVVARITPLGTFNATTAESMMTIEAMKRGRSIAGDWQQSGTHRRCQIVEG